ncbi:MAG: hypothetical protein HY906_04180 [Deltaproteobacteria bacterium]|nr:hypothetical protein [Deltaproteobacteria bacterium]
MGGQDGLEATIELANADQLRLDPASRHSKIRIALARTERKQMHAGGAGYATARLLVLVGYANRPGDFDAGLKDFDAFLSTVVVARR